MKIFKKRTKLNKFALLFTIYEIRVMVGASLNMTVNLFNNQPLKMHLSTGTYFSR